MAVECEDDVDCSFSVGTGSVCRSDGFCSNPFESGCFHALNQSLYGELAGSRMRVCNSDDTQDTISKGLCRQPDIEYMEIRLFANNWESSVFENWIIQILLSELLDIPTTVETGQPDRELSFYEKHNRYEYGDNFDTNSLAQATALKGDCSQALKEGWTESEGGVEGYQYCAHMVPEVWDVKTPWVQDLVRDSIIEPPQALGMLGQEGWFVTRFTALEDPSVASYFGLMGDSNREKLAKLFKRPIRWGDYCTQISSNNCTTPDGTASRAPTDDWEYDRFFVPDVYTGYFRYTDRNNCTEFSNCTGHMADYPCGWSNYVQGQLHYLNISLESNGRQGEMGGYSYTELTELWRAANATKENLMMYWYSPEPMYQEFLGSDAEFQRVTFQPPTQQCVDARNLVKARCSEELEDRIGSPEGICDDSAVPLSKLISSGLEMATNDPSIIPALKSPALDVLRFFSMSELQLGELITDLHQSSSPREAICKWAVDNVDYLESFIPSSYPRVVSEDESNYSWLKYAATLLGVVVVVLVMITTATIYKQRERPVIQFAQVDFLMLLLAGAFFVGFGAVTTGLDATDGSCISSIWLINIGYTLELVPLCVKIAAINKLAQAARKLRRIKVSKRSLFCSVFVFSILVVPFLILWTILDPPQPYSDYSLTEDQTSSDETIVHVEYHCASESIGWKYASIGWNVALLSIATVLAIQSRHCRAEFNESSSLGTLIYSHSIFVVMRVITYFLNDHVSQYVLGKVQSLIFSVDTIATLAIYFMPKILASDRVLRPAASSSMHNFASSDNFLVSMDPKSFSSASQDGASKRNLYNGSGHRPLPNRWNRSDNVSSSELSKISSHKESSSQTLDRLEMVTDSTEEDHNNEVPVFSSRPSRRILKGTSKTMAVDAMETSSQEESLPIDDFETMQEGSPPVDRIESTSSYSNVMETGSSEFEPSGESEGEGAIITA